MKPHMSVLGIDITRVYLSPRERGEYRAVLTGLRSKGESGEHSPHDARLERTSHV